ncbi:MAG: rubrerythrin family protein [Terrimicrobiaceae bacterium]|nr:rubrerythrin family protein [Terrimicrobiaceae bacterium]
MKTRFILVWLGCVAVALTSQTVRAEASAQTIKNLNVAYRGESNASHRYAKFAEKAEKDGFPEVAKLFRAASASEAIHRDNHQQAILALGGKVETFELDAVTPGTTAENLKEAIKGETYEQTTMYPEFLALAEKEDARPAMRTLRFAMETEKAHAKLYQAALDNLGKQEPVDYYVCRVCGMTVNELPAKKCVVCRKSRDEYKKIS